MNFVGPINSAFNDRNSLVFIIPTTEQDKKAEEDIAEYVKNFQKYAFKNTPILTDKEALEFDLCDKSILVYGTIEGNLWLKEQSTKFPFVIDKDKIIADQNYKGNGLRYITAWPNPLDKTRGVIIYTAQQAKDVVGINSIFHGPTDFVIIRGEEVLQSGQ